MKLPDSARPGLQISPAFAIGAIVALGAILLLLALMLIRGFDETRTLRADARRSYETRAVLQHVLSLHQDMETAQRGFQITRDRQFLQPYANATREIDTAFARLDEALSGSPLRSRLTELHRKSDEKRAFVDRIIGLVVSGDLAEAQRRVSDGDGRRLMDTLRAEIADMDADESARLIRRAERADAALLRLQRLNFVVKAALFLVIAVAVLLAMRSYREGKDALRRLEDNRARMAAILNSAKDGMIVLNPSGSIESLNPAAVSMYGYEEKEDLLRRDIGILFEVAPDRGQIETFLKRLEAQRSGRPGQIQEFVAARRDGSVFPVEVAVSAVDQAGSTMFLAVIRDVSERKNIERMKDEFVSTVSHELRTPLTSIAGSLGLLAGGAAGEIPEQALRLIEIARNNSNRLVRLINDILDIEKIESGKMRFDLKPLVLAPFLEAAVQANASFAAEYGVSVVLEPIPADAAVMADEDRLMQIMANLLSNASKFSPAGETVTVAVRPLDRRYRISVTDHGPGIAEEFRGRIFDKFAQEDSSISRQKGGTGLGLSIVKEIAARMRGSVTFESEIGKGTVFHVDLPVAEEIAEDDGARATPTPVPGSDRPHLLHVDDDPDMLRVVATIFGSRATVRSVRHLAEARGALARERFDAVILDIGMEDSVGLDLVPQVRGNSPGTPIVVFTAQDDAGQLKDVDAVLVKSRASLEKLVEEVLRLAHAAMANEEKT